MFRNVFGLIAIVVTILAALNVYGDFSGVEAEARAVVEREGTEKAFLSQVSRNPIAHTYVFVVKGRASVQVSCLRELILIGDYRCAKE